jgi:hypothetical protein
MMERMDLIIIDGLHCSVDDDDDDDDDDDVLTEYLPY